jgi:hypothetical protein
MFSSFDCMVKLQRRHIKRSVVERQRTLRGRPPPAVVCKAPNATGLSNARPWGSAFICFR